MPISTPWGVSQTADKYGDGITFYSTASHGGFHVREDLNNQIPEYARRAKRQHKADLNS